jgi:hypothetical protein
MVPPNEQSFPRIKTARNRQAQTPIYAGGNQVFMTTTLKK